MSEKECKTFDKIKDEVIGSPETLRRQLYEAHMKLGMINQIIDNTPNDQVLGTKARQWRSKTKET